MNRVAAVAVSSVAVAIIISVFVLQPARKERGIYAASGEPASLTVEAPSVGQSEQPSTPASQAAQTETTPATGAAATAELALTETDATDVDFETLAAAVPTGQIPATLSRLGGSEHDQNLSAELLRRWASDSPVTAAQWAAALPDEQSRHNALRTVAAQWAGADLQTAHQWAQTLDGAERDVVITTLATEAASQNPLDALHLALEIQEPAARANAVSFAVAQWAADDPQAALDWTVKVTDTQLRQQLDRRMTPVLAEADPAAAADYISGRSRQSPDSSQAQTAVEIAQRWAQQAPETAAHWVETFPGSLRERAMDAVMRIWSEADSVGAQQWFSRLAASDFRDEAAIAYASAIASLERANALDVASTIQDAVKRQQLLARIGSGDAR